MTVSRRRMLKSMIAALEVPAIVSFPGFAKLAYGGGGGASTYSAVITSSSQWMYASGQIPAQTTVHVTGSRLQYSSAAKATAMATELQRRYNQMVMALQHNGVAEVPTFAAQIVTNPQGTLTSVSDMQNKWTGGLCVPVIHQPDGSCIGGPSMHGWNWMFDLSQGHQNNDSNVGLPNGYVPKVVASLVGSYVASVLTLNGAALATIIGASLLAGGVTIGLYYLVLGIQEQNFPIINPVAGPSPPADSVTKPPYITNPNNQPTPVNPPVTEPPPPDPNDAPHPPETTYLDRTQNTECYAETPNFNVNNDTLAGIRLDDFA